MGYPKGQGHQYYYLSPVGRRLFELGLGSATLAFIGAGSKADILEARRLIASHGSSWSVEWLRARGQLECAEHLAKSYGPAEPSVLELKSRNGYVNGHYFKQANGTVITPNEGANTHGTIP